MIHDIDIILNVLFGHNYSQLYSAGNESSCLAVMTFDGPVVSLSASRMACKKIRSIYVEDREFTIEGDFMNQEVFTFSRPDKFLLQNERYTQENIIEKVLINKVEPLSVELKTFINCVKKGTEFPITPQQALANMTVCKQIARQLIGNRSA